MATTTIRRIVNNSPYRVTVRNYERAGDGVRTAPANGGEVEVIWDVPHCTSPEEFANGKRLVLRYSDGARVFEYSIWQQSVSGDGGFIRFTDDAGGLTQYTYRDANQSDARKLATNEQGAPYHVTGNTDAILRIKVVNNAIWVILTRA